MIDVDSTTTDLDRLARQLKVLAEPTRLRIIDRLIEGIQCTVVGLCQT